MALSNDQKAMLRLLAQREQGYEDIAALMGLSVEQVRVKVKEALDEIDSEAPVQPTPQAPTPVETPSPPPEPIPAPKPAPAPLPPAAKASSSPAPKASSPTSRRSMVEWLGGAAIVLLLVLFITGAIDLGGGDSDSSTTASESSPTGGATTTAGGSSQATQAILKPVDGSDAEGVALFGRIKKTAMLQVQANGLEPSPKGQSYTVWLYRSPKVVLRVGAVAVGQNGKLAAQFPIPAEVLAYVAGGAFDQIDVSLTPNAAYEAEVAQAKQQKRLPAYTGTDILRGKITGPAIQN